MSESAEAAPELSEPPALLTLVRIFLVIGAVAFGGLGATIRLLQRELVEKHGWLQPGDVSEAMAFTKTLPGSTGVQIVTFLGWRLKRWPGALVATVAYLFPSLALMTAAAAGFAALPEAPWVQGAVNGILVAVVGLLAMAIWRMARSEASTPLLAGVLVAAMIAGFFVNAAFIVVTAGLFGLVLRHIRLRQQHG
ncbi:MAG: chromate transporter [Rhodospirillales bacterium]